MRIMIVDDHAIVRRGITYIVQQGFPNADVVEAGGAATALELMRLAPVDIALVDVWMPDFDGLELLRSMKTHWADVPVIMISNYENAPYVKRALADGAAGYLLKDATPEDLWQAIKVAMSGGGNVLSSRLVQSLFEGKPMGSIGLAIGKGRSNEYHLTHRERGILELLAEGKSNRAIAQSLHLSEKTVKTHLAAIFRKLGVTNRTQAAIEAVRMGLGPVHGSPAVSSSG